MAIEGRRGGDQAKDLELALGKCSAYAVRLVETTLLTLNSLER
jgi:hypothetical protein